MSGKCRLWKKKDNKKMPITSSFLHKKRKQPEIPKHRVSPSEFKSNLNLFCDWAQKNNVRLIFIDAWPTQLQYRKIMSCVAQQRNIKIISQYNLILKIQDKPEDIISQKRFLKYLFRVKSNFKDEYLKSNPEFYGVIDYVHPNEIANIMLVEKLLDVVIN